MKPTALLGTALALGLLAGPGPAMADDATPQMNMFDASVFDSGKLLATGGVSNIEGAGGGGISTWALISGYGDRDGVGGTAHYTYTGLSNYSVNSAGAAIGLFDRVEISANHLWCNTGFTGARLGLGQGFTLQEDVLGLKVKLFGDAIYDQDSWLPQVAIGTEFKQTDHADILKLLGAKSNQGVDFYVAASKLFINESVLANATLRLTKANQIGILGFGGPKNDGYQAEFEGSLAYLFTRNFAVGAEYRTMPGNLGLRSSDWKTAYAAYFLNKNASVTLAYANLGTIATFKNQQGVYLSAQLSF